MLALPGLLELGTMSSALGRTKPARFRRSRIIWPLMLMSSGELEWRLQGKGTRGSRTASGHAPESALIRGHPAFPIPKHRHEGLAAPQRVITSLGVVPDYCLCLPGESTW